MGEITLSTPEFKALSSESRTRILKLLEDRNHTLTELSSKLEMAAPTIKQHLTVLLESGLIEMNDEGRKWKYYSLTRKGKNITSPADQTHFLIVLSFASIALIALLAFVFYPIMAPEMGGESVRTAVLDEVAPTQAFVPLENDVLEDSARFNYNRQMMVLCQPECGDCDPFNHECDNECERCVKE
jgi:DNA-binding transcriptional ArsR family regulator